MATTKPLYGSTTPVPLVTHAEYERRMREIEPSARLYAPHAGAEAWSTQLAQAEMHYAQRGGQPKSWGNAPRNVGPETVVKQ